MFRLAAILSLPVLLACLAASERPVSGPSTSGPSASVPASIPASRPLASLPDAQAPFVRQTLAAIEPGDPLSAEMAQQALVARGKDVVPALQAALAWAKDQERSTAAAALVQIQRGYDPARKVQEFLKQQKDFPADAMRRISPLTLYDELVAGVLPDCVFVLVRFRSYPVAQAPPAPLEQSNLLAIDGKGYVSLIVNKDQLGKFFVNHLAPVSQDKEALAAAQAYLLLFEELVQDGMTRFEIPSDQLTATRSREGLDVIGEAVATVGARGRGGLEALLRFNSQGRLTAVQAKGAGFGRAGGGVGR